MFDPWKWYIYKSFLASLMSSQCRVLAEENSAHMQLGSKLGDCKTFLAHVLGVLLSSLRLVAASLDFSPGTNRISMLRLHLSEFKRWCLIVIMIILYLFSFILSLPAGFAPGKKENCRLQADGVFKRNNFLLPLLLQTYCLKICFACRWCARMICRLASS